LGNPQSSTLAPLSQDTVKNWLTVVLGFTAEVIQLMLPDLLDDDETQELSRSFDTIIVAAQECLGKLDESLVVP
jgi:hypothetical protein